MVGIFSLGTEVIPWEHRENFQRLVARLPHARHLPLRGRDYSELFDALGSSRAARSRSRPRRVARRARRNSSVADPSAAKVYFTGMTDVQATAAFASPWQ